MCLARLFWLGFVLDSILLTFIHPYFAPAAIVVYAVFKFLPYAYSIGLIVSLVAPVFCIAS